MSQKALTPAVRPIRRRVRRDVLQENIEVWLMMLPVLLVIFLFSYIPLWGTIIAVQDYVPGSPFFGSEFVGLRWIVKFCKSVYFERLLVNTLRLSLLQLLFSFWVPIIFALFLNEVTNLRYKKFVQTCSYMPYFVSSVVVAGMAISFLDPNGLINNLIALFGGLAGIVAQTRQDRTSTVIPGVAIATALIPPLCTAGFGLATGQFRFFIGAFYLFFINSVFIALATYAMVRFLQYEKKVFIDKVRERTVKRLMMVITLVTFIPSVVIGFHMVRVSLFEAVADKYVSQVFNFPHTRVIECNKYYAQGKNPSQIELLLVGEPLGEEVIENARTQMRNFGLEEAELVVRQANTEDKVDVVSLQKSYQELLEEKNRRIGEMSSQLKRYRVTNVEVNDISREVGAMMDNIGAISLTKGITFDVEGTPGDTTLVCVVTPRDSALPVDRETLIRWLRIRTKVENVKLFVEP